jgi:hypothetical protein
VGGYKSRERTIQAKQQPNKTPQMQTTPFIHFAKRQDRFRQGTAIFLGIFSLALGASSSAFAATPAWVAQYDVGKNDDVPVAIQTDNFGNTYVAGTTQEPFYPNNIYTRLVKYSSTGTQLWEQSYAASGVDTPVALAVDSGGNPILLIQTAQFGEATLLTIKYTSLGSTAWIASHHGFVGGPNYKDSQGKRLAVDGADNVYITAANPNGDIMVKKYAAANGAELWGASYDAGGADTGVQILVKNLYVYVVGVSQTPSGNDNIVVVQLQKGTGIRNWVSVYNKDYGDTYHYNFPNAICSDDSDRLYVTGVGNFKMITLRYNTAGNLTWEYRDSFVNTVGLDIASTSAGIFVAGKRSSYFDNVEHGTPLTMMHQFNGTVNWRTEYASPSSTIPYDLAVDTAGNAYIVAGRFDGTLDEVGSELKILKYNSFGTLLWNESYPAAGTALSPFRLTLDSSNNIYATRPSYTPGAPTADVHWLTLKYNAH